MSNETSNEVRSIAGNYFKEGYNCAEAMILTFREYYGQDFDPNIVKLFTGFGDGMGKSGCSCGALVGSIAVLNMIKGRTSNEVDRLEAYKIANEFHDCFKQKFNSTCCRVLSKGYEHGTKERLTNCLKITGNTAKLLAEFLEEKGYGLNEELGEVSL